MSLDYARHYSAYVDIALTALDRSTVVSLDNACHYSAYIDITLTACTVMTLENACHFSAYFDITLTALDESTIVSLDNASHYSAYIDITLTACTVLSLDNASHYYIIVHLYELRHEISNNVVCATSKVSDQPAHMHSLSVHLSKCHIVGNLMPRLIY